MGERAGAATVSALPKQNSKNPEAARAGRAGIPLGRGDDVYEATDLLRKNENFELPPRAASPAAAKV